MQIEEDEEKERVEEEMKDIKERVEEKIINNDK